MSYFKFPCARPKYPGYRQVPHHVRRWMGPGSVYDAPYSHPIATHLQPVATPFYPYFDQNWYACRPVAQPNACVQPPVFRRNIDPIYPFPVPKYDLYNPPTRTKLPHFEFPKVPEPPKKCPQQPPACYYPCGSDWPHPPFLPTTYSGQKGDPGIHPILSEHRHRLVGPNLLWILSDDPFYYSRWEDAAAAAHFPGLRFYCQQAAHPSQDINTIRIRYDHNDSVGRIGKELGCIDIVRRDAATHITVKDVLRGISEHFMKPLTTEELVKAEEYGEASLTRAMKDFRAYSRPGQIAPNDCMRRIDALGYLSRFGGLSVIEVKDGVLELSLNLLSCLDRRGA